MTVKHSFQMDDATLKRLGAAIRDARKGRKLTLAEVGAAAGGASPQAAGQWERGVNAPSTANLMAIGKLLGLDVQSIIENRPQVIRPAGPERAEVEFVGEGLPDAGDEDMELLGVAEGGADGWFTIGEVIDRVRRPPGLRKARDAAALNVTGDSMEPRFSSGDLIYVHKRPPATGDDVVVELYAEQDGQPEKAFLKRFVRKTGLRIYCRQFNPPADVEFDAGEVKNLWRVVPLRELLF